MIPPVAIDRAVEEVMSFYEDDAPWRMDAERFVKVAAPIIAEAAVEGIKARIQALPTRPYEAGPWISRVAALAAIDKEGEHGSGE